MIAIFGFMPMVLAQTFIQTFNASTNLNEGTVVKISPHQASTVEPVTQATSAKALGVVVDTGKGGPSSTPSNGRLVNVATSGHFNVLVSNQSGPILPGDYLTISSIPGVSMRDNGSQSTTIGQALDAFNGHEGLIQANINIASNPLENNQQKYVPPFLRRAVGVINNGKLISPWRIYLALVLVVASAIITLSVLYGGIRGAMLAVGRNPLAKKTILRTLMITIGTGLVILVAGAVAAVLVLRI